jgi:hypothetical protein
MLEAIKKKFQSSKDKAQEQVTQKDKKERS